MTFPDVVSREQWLEARKLLLAQEKNQTRKQDALNAQRRRLPMVRVEQEYVFGGPRGAVSLARMFGGCRQLIVHHIMFGPDWDEPCPSCRNFMDELSAGLIAHLHDRDTAFALVSRAPRAKIEAYQASRGWTVDGPVSVTAEVVGTGEAPVELTATWYSSYGSDFNYDFEVTLDESRAQYNYRAEPGLLGGKESTEMPGTGCFLRDGEDVFHTYSAYGRGNEYIPSLYTLLDLTALGRQEGWEEPKGRAPVLHG
jgi:predicted dithiol-disulfide oxidoreductase (DUF899 family)